MNEKNNKISILIGGLSGGGAERVVCELANTFIGKGWDINILTMSDKNESYFLKPNVEVYPLLHQYERKNSLHNLMIRYMRLKKYIKSVERDCYVVMLPATTIMMLLLKVNKMKVKVIVAERSAPERYSWFIKWLLRILSHRADGFIFQTEEVERWYKPYIKQVKTIIIPNTISEEFLSNSGKNIKENHIIAAGRLIAIKNFSMLIKAFSRISEKYPEYRLYIFGEGPERKKLEELIKELNIEECVIMPGYVKNLKEELEKSKLFVMSSNFEGMPNSLIEAMAVGLPCISTDCMGGGARYLIQDKINGYLVEVGDDAQMAHYMDLILSSEQLAMEIGTRAREITEKLNPNKIYAMWESFIKKTIDKADR